MDKEQVQAWAAAWREVNRYQEEVEAKRTVDERWLLLGMMDVSGRALPTFRVRPHSTGGNWSVLRSRDGRAA